MANNIYDKADESVSSSIGKLNQDRIVLFEKRVLAEKQERLAKQQISQEET